MKNNQLNFIILLCSLLCIISCSKHEKKQANYPAPFDTIVYQDAEENEDNTLNRKLWIDKMHRTAPGKNWRKIEYKNSKSKVQFGLNSKQSDQVILGDSLYQGRWKERGSNNQAGSINAVTYLTETNMIYCISAGGTLWKGLIDGTDWQVVNQSYQFDVHSILFLDNVSGEKRMIATIARIPHYSDDFGLTWQAAQGISSTGDSWSRTANFEAIKLEDGSTRLYCLSKASYSDRVKLFYSEDLGETYSQLHNTNKDEFDFVSLCKPHGSQDLIIASSTAPNKLKLQQVNHQNNSVQFISSSSEVTVSNDDRIILVGNYQGQDSILYALEASNTVKVSKDAGKTWEYQASIDDTPWDIGFYVSPTDPNQLFYGNIEAYRMEGNTFEKVNDWWEYYDDVPSALHADIMTIKEFTDTQGQPFLLIGNHGGLSISYNNMESNQNIGIEGLNVAQYYDVRTDPNNPDVVYAGSQDQGYQRTTEMNKDGSVDFDQVISGDYGHLTFSRNGEGMWTGYPGGRIRFYLNPQFSDYADFYEIDSENESSWLTPMAAIPTSDEHEILVAGGDINGGLGSHLIKLKSVGFQGIEAEQFPFDFRTTSNTGIISAIEASPINPNLIYVATDEGILYTSTDGGETFDIGYNAINNGHYLYGASIYASKINENEVWIAGSGYDNDGVLYSDDYGSTFSLFTDGLPATLVFEITANADETQLFAATESGPYVYLAESNQWEDLSQGNAPVQTYWSVEYLEDQKIVRFGTYGRGIWDFNFEESIDVATEELVAFDLLTAYPNPAEDILNLKMNPNISNRDIEISMFDASGKLVYQSGWQTSIPMQNFAQGIYSLRINTETKIQVIQISKL